MVERTQQAGLLNLTRDAIFVRDMSGTIRYWSRGAEAMFGWTADEASGNTSNRLLKTAFPEPPEQIEAKLMGAGRWEGELVHTRKKRNEGNRGEPVVFTAKQRGDAETEPSNKRHEYTSMSASDEHGLRSIMKELVHVCLAMTDYPA